VHLWLGDVIECSSRSVAEFLSDQREVNAWNLKHPDEVLANGRTLEGYVKPLSYYRSVIDAYRNSPDSDSKEVLILGGTHKAMSLVKSTEYAEAIVVLFQEHGFIVTLRVSMVPSVQEADQDFTDMCNASYFVPSGGGFSNVAAQLVTKRSARAWNDLSGHWTDPHRETPLSSCIPK
jgi:hypothetical protein